MSGLAGRPVVSLVVAVLDQADAVTALLDHVASLDGVWEVVVADGGSRDGTAAVARAHPLAPKVGRAVRGRLPQLETGAGVATGDVVAFLDVHSRMTPDAYGDVARALRDPARRAGVLARSAHPAIWLRAEEWRRLGAFPPASAARGDDLLGRAQRRWGAVRSVASGLWIRYACTARVSPSRLLSVYANIN